ncbi:glycosyltransferase [Leptolyngbya iicbica]|uniref:Glycosyltransferase n=2 Tax=Cyanophyceae TaxID=3028117 RepID=A0A4Q7DZT9_9CYAN|nr:glycosyltransferase [Leptolyngbya sp. LK]RZM75077.1 glycosyltransferase [Leptolyngbya sp. LK]
MKLSVVLAVYNAEDTISEQLEALARQTWDEPWELIVANNGSKDQTQAIVESFSSKIANLKIIDASQRKGASYARNKGVEVAQASMIAFCDADDIVRDNWIAEIAAAIEQHGFVCGPMSIAALNPGWRIQEPIGVRVGDELFHASDLSDHYFPPFPKDGGYFRNGGTCNMGILKSIHQDIGGFDEEFLRYQDGDYCIRAQLKGYKLHFAPQAIVEYRYRLSLRDTFSQFRDWGKWVMLIPRKYGPPTSLRKKISYVFGGWWSLPLEIIKVRSRAGLFALITGFAIRLGQSQGCIEFMVLPDIQDWFAAKFGNSGQAEGAVNQDPKARLD